ncbi:MAG: TolC family protein, partial [bacterium]
MNFKKLLVLMFVTGISTGSGFSQSQPPVVLSLQKAIDLAIENNENVLIAMNDVQTAHAQIREAWADALPQVTFNGIYTRNIKQPVIFLPEIFIFPGGDPNKQIPIRFGSTNSYAMTVSLEQTIYQSGKVSSGIKAAQLFKKFSKQGFQAVKSEVLLQVKRAFYTVQLDQQ